MIKVSNRRFVSAAQILKCAPMILAWSEPVLACPRLVLILVCIVSCTFMFDFGV